MDIPRLHPSFYYMYLAYTIYQHYYLVEYGYDAWYYSNKLYKFLYLKPKIPESVDADWVLCDMETSDNKDNFVVIV